MNNEIGKCPNCGEMVSMTDLVTGFVTLGCVHCQDEIEAQEQDLFDHEATLPDYMQRV